MFTNENCTIFNAYYDASQRCKKWKATVIYGVYWEEACGQTSETNGLKGDASAWIVIPKSSVDVSAYQEPKEFYKNPIGFTFAPNDVVVRGVHDVDCSRLSNFTSLDGSHTVLKVYDFTYGSESLQHWEVHVK